MRLPRPALLFILARAANPPGAEVLWVPGGVRPA